MSGPILPQEAPGASAPGPSYLESPSLCQDTGADTECGMLLAVSVIPHAPGIGVLLILFSLKTLFSVVTWVLGKKLFTCCQSWGWKQKHHQSQKSRVKAKVLCVWEGRAVSG